MKQNFLGTVKTNRLRGFAFVTFDDEDSADKCIQRRTHEICKKICEVKRAQTRSNLNKFEDDDFHGGRGNSGNRGNHHQHHRNNDRDGGQGGTFKFNVLYHSYSLSGVG